MKACPPPTERALKELETQNQQLREAQFALEASRNRYADLYDFAPLAHFTFDERGCVLEANLAGAELVGRPRNQLVGASFPSLVTMDEPEHFWDHLRRCAQTRTEVVSEFAVTTHDGERKFLQATSAPRVHLPGQAPALRTALHDITEHKRIEQQRQQAWESEQALRKQLQRIDHAMMIVTQALASLAGSDRLSHILQVIVDQARTVVDADYAAFGALADEPGPAFASWLFSGIEPQTAEAIGRLPTSRGAIGAVLRAEGPVRLSDVRTHPEFIGFPANHPDMTSLLSVPVRYGTRTLGNLYLSNKRGGVDFTDEDQRSVEMLAERVGIAMEIARLNDAAATALKSRDSVLAIVSHDLRNPLSIISMNAALALRANAQGGRALPKEPLENIRLASVRMGRLIQDLLQASTIESGHFNVEAQSEAPESMVQECVQLQEPVLTAKSLRLVTELAPNLPHVHCDRDRVLQVLSNLIGNAAKFTPAGGTIRLQVTPANGCARFAVADTGCGIAAENLPRLFDRYWKGSSTGKRGTGLGLFIARGIVEAHGGEMWVESQPGVGSTFFFTLPAATERAQPALTVLPHEGGSRLKGLKVLLVDDEASAVSALTALLTDDGLVVSSATSGEQALAIAEAWRPEVVVLDVEMPGMGGLAMLEQLRARQPGLPAVIMSGYLSGHSGIKEALDAPGVSYLSKPIDVDELLDTLAELFPTRAPSA